MDTPTDHSGEGAAAPARRLDQCRRCLTMKNIQVGVDVCDRCLAHPADESDKCGPCMIEDHGNCTHPPLCGDPTCEGPGCRQSSIDAWHQRQWDEAGELVAGSLGLTYDRSTGTFGGS